MIKKLTSVIMGSFRYGFLHHIRTKGYFKRLWLAIKGERYIDTDYISRAFDSILAQSLPKIYKNISKNAYIEPEMEKDMQLLIKHCNRYAENIYKYPEIINKYTLRGQEKKLKNSRKIICTILEKRGPDLRR